MPLRHLWFYGAFFNTRLFFLPNHIASVLTFLTAKKVCAESHRVVLLNPIDRVFESKWRVELNGFKKGSIHLRAVSVLAFRLNGSQKRKEEKMIAEFTIMLLYQLYIFLFMYIFILVCRLIVVCICRKG